MYQTLQQQTSYKQAIPVCVGSQDSTQFPQLINAASSSTGHEHMT